MIREHLSLVGWLLTLGVGGLVVAGSLPDKRVLALVVAGGFFALATISLWGHWKGSTPLQAMSIPLVLGAAALGKDGFFFLPGGLLLVVPFLLGLDVRPRSLFVVAGVAGITLGATMASVLVPPLDTSCREAFAAPQGAAPMPNCPGRQTNLEVWFLFATAGLIGGSTLALLAGVTGRGFLGFTSVLGYSVGVIANPTSTLGAIGLLFGVVVLVALLKGGMLARPRPPSPQASVT